MIFKGTKLKKIFKLNKYFNEDLKICSYCNRPFTKKLWCRSCDPFNKIEGWTSGNYDIDKFIKEEVYKSRFEVDVSDEDIFYDDFYNFTPSFIEWIPYNRLKNIKQIASGGFSKVYFATWLDGKAKYSKQFNGNWEKLDPKPIKVALKKLIGSQNILPKYLNEFKKYLDSYDKSSLKIYGITRDPKTNEFIMVMQIANKGSLRETLLYDFHNMLWKYKILCLHHIIIDLNNFHKLGYPHKNFHSGNILQNGNEFYISDFGLYGSPNVKDLSSKICGVLPYLAPEVINGNPYKLSSDIYSFGIIMTELSSGKPPFHDWKHDTSLSLAVCNGLRPEFGRGTPSVYKKLAIRCMDADPKNRPTCEELREIISDWFHSIKQGKEFKYIFEKADEEIPNISSTYKKDPDSIYTSRILTFRQLPDPVNSLSNENDY